MQQGQQKKEQRYQKIANATQPGWNDKQGRPPMGAATPGSPPFQPGKQLEQPYCRHGPEQQEDTVQKTEHQCHKDKEHHFAWRQATGEEPNVKQIGQRDDGAHCNGQFICQGRHEIKDRYFLAQRITAVRWDSCWLWRGSRYDHSIPLIVDNAFDSFEQACPSRLWQRRQRRVHPYKSSASSRRYAAIAAKLDTD